MHLLRAALAALLVVATGCNLFNTTDAEESLGRGAEAFDPYSSSQSGAIALSLTQFKGCAVLPDGRTVTKGSLKLPGYPDTCTVELIDAETLVPDEPTATLEVLADQEYFLNQFAAMDQVIGRFPDDPEARNAKYNDRNAPAVWMRKHSQFKSLDWTGLSVGREDWRPINSPQYMRETFYENAAWMLKRDDTLMVEVLDADGTPRASKKYDRGDFLGENSYSGRSRVSWTVNHVLRPTFPGDPVLQMMPNLGPVEIPMVRVAFSTSTNPFKTFKMPNLKGPGVIRVTWSQMPNEPFLFPVNFIEKQELAPSCFKVDERGVVTDTPVACDFGLKQQVTFDTPANGKFYVPGEEIEFRVSLRDGSGNALHGQDHMPSVNASKAGEANGVLYFNSFTMWTLREMSGSESGFKLTGPLDKMRLSATAVPSFFAYPETPEPAYYLDNTPVLSLTPGALSAPVPTRYKVKLPEDAKPGTYALYVKGHRYHLGERLNRLDPFHIQVGQEEPTEFPNRIGNCQICHRGVVSMSNIMHGMDVDHVEGCKSCHTDKVFGQTADMIHRVHASSQKYPAAKSDCTMCHLTRESATAPSPVACGGCHMGLHGSEYFDLQFQELDVTPNAYSNCANACHALPDNTPQAHFLPE